MKFVSSILQEAGRARDRLFGDRGNTQKMTEHQTELHDIAERQEALAKTMADPQIAAPLEALEANASEVAKSFCGSWLGYHSRIYYQGLQTPPAGARFSAEWGLMDMYSARETRGDWEEYNVDEVKGEIYRRAGNPDLTAIRAAVDDVKRQFESDKAAAISVFSVLGSDTYLDKLKNEIEKLEFHTESDVVQALAPSGSKMTRDMVAASGGMQVPAHCQIAATVFVLREPQEHCRRLAKATRAASAHIARKASSGPKIEQGTHVFIGHGRSPLWRELKDFLQDKLHLPCDEFNRVPVAGVTNIARLGQMLDAAAFAFLVMTGEDETAAGTLRARMNVVHEAGLFQGKLGFTRAIVLLEEGCEEFSNIAGLGQIHFPKGNIKAAFQEIREVLEREELIKAGA